MTERVILVADCLSSEPQFVEPYWGCTARGSGAGGQIPSEWIRGAWIRGAGCVNLQCVRVLSTRIRVDLGKVLRVLLMDGRRRNPGEKFFREHRSPTNQPLNAPLVSRRNMEHGDERGRLGLGHSQVAIGLPCMRE